MIIDRANLAGIFTGYKSTFNKGFEGALSAYKKIAMTVPSSTTREVYPFLGQFPGMREWIGPRIVRNLSLHGFTIENRTFEDTISVPRTAIEDDTFGVFSPMFQEMGRAAGEHPDQLIFALLASGFNQLCYDGQYFFDMDHPTGPDEATVSTSNFGGGTGTAWYLLDTSRAIKPLIYQERIPVKLTEKTQETDDNVFWRDEYIYGARGRSNAGFGLWQLAYASKQVLDGANYAAARNAMHSLKGVDDRTLGVRPTILVVPTILEEQALKLIGSAVLANGETNPWYKSVDVVVTPWANL